MAETILITGGCGFVGSNIAVFLKHDYPTARIIAFDNLKRRGAELNISRLKEYGIEYIHGDIRNKEDFSEIGAISILIEAAAEPSVLSGIDSTPDYVLNTNLSGTINCLNFAIKNKAKFIFLSTSRVYPVANLNKLNYTEHEQRFVLQDAQELPGVSSEGISEQFPLDGARSFYGTSKLASEMLIQEYAAFYGLEAVINRCGVIAGPWQMGKVDQGVIVLWLAKHFWQQELSYIGFGGSGKQVRDVLHIADLCDLVKIQLNDFSRFAGEIFNVGGGNDISISLKELTLLCEAITGNQIPIGQIKENRVADIPVYLTDNSKIQKASGWLPKRGIKQLLQDTYEWMKENEKIIDKVLK